MLIHRKYRLSGFQRPLKAKESALLPSALGRWSSPPGQWSAPNRRSIFAFPASPSTAGAKVAAEGTEPTVPGRQLLFSLCSSAHPPRLVPHASTEAAHPALGNVGSSKSRLGCFAKIPEIEFPPVDLPCRQSTPRPRPRARIPALANRLPIRLRRRFFFLPLSVCLFVATTQQ
jgi:hypothetical protein